MGCKWIFFNKKCNSEHLMLPTTCLTRDCGCPWSLADDAVADTNCKKSSFRAVTDMLLTQKIDKNNP